MDGEKFECRLFFLRPMPSVGSPTFHVVDPQSHETTFVQDLPTSFLVTDLLHKPAVAAVGNGSARAQKIALAAATAQNADVDDQLALAAASALMDDRGVLTDDELEEDNNAQECEHQHDDDADVNADLDSSAGLDDDASTADAVEYAVAAPALADAGLSWARHCAEGLAALSTRQRSLKTPLGNNGQIALVVDAVHSGDDVPEAVFLHFIRSAIAAQGSRMARRVNLDSSGRVIFSSPAFIKSKVYPDTFDNTLMIILPACGASMRQVTESLRETMPTVAIRLRDMFRLALQAEHVVENVNRRILSTCVCAAKHKKENTPQKTNVAKFQWGKPRHNFLRDSPNNDPA